MTAQVDDRMWTEELSPACLSAQHMFTSDREQVACTCIAGCPHVRSKACVLAASLHVGSPDKEQLQTAVDKCNKTYHWKATTASDFLTAC